MSEQVKSIKDKEFEFKPEPLAAGVFIGIVIIAAFALAGYMALNALGKVFDFWDLIFPVAGAAALYPLKMHHDKMARQSNYIDYLSKIPIEELISSHQYLDTESKILVKKFLDGLVEKQNNEIGCIKSKP
mgnify:FL=1